MTRGTIRAAYFTPRGFDVRRVPRPLPQEDEALIEVYGCGICGSDLHRYEGAEPPPQVCAGHEICGRIAADSPADATRRFLDALDRGA